MKPFDISSALDVNKELTKLRSAHYKITYIVLIRAAL